MSTHFQVQNASAVEIINRKFVGNNFYTAELRITTADSPIPTIITLFSAEPLTIAAPLSETPFIEIS